MFDPYHKWLGIRKDQRPPTFYQLLGISSDETDLEVIEEAAIRQTAHIRTYQIGPHAKDCTQLLNEISQARTTLLNPAKRKEYDLQLAKKAAGAKKQIDAAHVTATPSPAPRVEAAPPSLAGRFDDLDDDERPALGAAAREKGPPVRNPLRKKASFSASPCYTASSAAAWGWCCSSFSSWYSAGPVVHACPTNRRLYSRRLYSRLTSLTKKILSSLTIRLSRKK